MTSDQDSNSEPAPRRYYIEGQIRASDLAEGDVLCLPGHDWREVLDVWTDGEADLVAEYAELTHDKALTNLIDKYLTGVGMYVLVRYLHEEPGSPVVPYRVASYRRCELVTVQVVDPTLPGSSLIEQYPALQRLRTQQPTAQWPDTRRKPPAREERT